MNIKLSVFSNRVKGKSGFAVYVNGDVKEKGIGKIASENIKEDVLISLTKGLRNCRNLVSHEDVLYIEIQNRHLCAWLDGNSEYEGYNQQLDNVFEVLESLDCRYRFMFVPKPTCKLLVENGSVEVKGSSIADAFEGLE